MNGPDSPQFTAGNWQLIICKSGKHFVLPPNFDCAKNEIIDN